MRIASRPQTSIRLVSKTFRKLYAIEDILNKYFEENLEDHSKIDSLQIFFDTDIKDEDFVRLLDLKAGILQAETSLNWDDFSRLELNQQQVLFLTKIRRVVERVIEAYNLDENMYSSAFDKTLKQLETGI